MRKTTTLMIAAATAAMLSTAASAQPYRGPDSGRTPSATFYELPNFKGRSVTVDGGVNNLSGLGFNDKARSARFDGTWTVCEDSEFRSRCETVSGQVRDFGVYNLDRRISSARSSDWNPGWTGPGGGYGGPGGGYGGPGGGYGDPGGGYGGGQGGYGGGWGPSWGANQGVEGRSVVFYARPRMNDVDLWGSGKPSADDFCRRMGHSYAVYFDISQKAPRAQDFSGRWYDNGAVLRDVLCHK